MTNGAPAVQASRVPPSPSQRIMLLTSTVAAAAVTLFVIVVRPLPEPSTALHLPWALWVAAFAVSELLVVHWQWNREAHSFSISDLVLAAGLYLAAPSQLIVALVVGVGLVLLVHRRQRGVKLAFNIAEYALSGTVAVLVFSAASHATGRGWDWLAALAAIVAATVTADLCVFAVISLLESRTDLRRLLELFALSLPFTLGAGAVGLVLARTVLWDPAALALLALPAILIVVSYRAYTGARQQQENLRLLHEVTSLLHGDDPDAAMGDFLTSVRTAFRAELAEVVLVGAGGRHATVSRSREGDEPVVMERADDSVEQEWLLRLATASGTLGTRTGVGRSGPLDSYAMGRGFKDAMVAALKTEDRMHGLLLVAGRVGDVTTFSSADLALLETFARHVATSLERGRLEETLRQVTDLKEQLRHQTLHDSLTGLPNRTLFLDRARQAVEVAARTHAWPAILYLDLDGFKPVNDEYGHDCGDGVLRTIAHRIKGCLRPADTAARLGGDEFAILLGGPIDQRDVNRVVDRVRAQFDVPIDIGDGRIATIGASIGGALGTPGIESADSLIRQADIAMYAAKRTGAGFLYFEPGMGDATSAREGRAAELAGAIRRGELVTVFQPLIDLRTGRPTGAEALVRWAHPVEGTRGPDQFIGLAEETGLIVEIGALVLRDACRQAARWARAGRGDLDITVNLSARQLADPRVVDDVRVAVTEAGLNPKRLVLEITETVLMQDREAAAATLWQLKALGVRIAIDDFGTGYSSLAYLRRFPIDILKIAREFVDGLGRDENDDVITRAIVELAGTLGLQTIAEGIETSDQQNFVTALGCDIGQGYLFSRPIDAEEAVAVLAGVGTSPAAVPVPRSGGDALFPAG